MYNVKRSMLRSWFQAAVALGLVAGAVSGLADPGAPSNALEVGVELGYSQPAGGSAFLDTTDRKLDTFVFAGLGGRFDL